MIPWVIKSASFFGFQPEAFAGDLRGVLGSECEIDFGAIW
jgi:hypothetical protein